MSVRIPDHGLDVFQKSLHDSALIINCGSRKEISVAVQITNRNFTAEPFFQEVTIGSEINKRKEDKNLTDNRL